MKKTLMCSIALTLLLFVSCKEAPTVQEVGTYDYLEITTADAEVVSRFSASIRGRQDINIMPQVSGTISEVMVTEGQRVEKGQTLFIIDQVPYEAALKTAEANVKAARASVATAKLTFDSKQELYAKSVISEYELRVAENQVLTAEATLAQAEAQFTNAKNSLGYTVVKSPANGVVGTIPHRVGALVGPSMAQPLTTVSDNTEMYVYFSMSEKQLLALTREHGSMEAALAAFPKPTLELTDGSTYEHEGYVESVSGVIDQTTGSISLRAVFPNPGELLHSGGSGNIVLNYKKPDCIIIPCIATYEIQNKTYVYQPVDGKASSKIISVEKYDGVNYIVTDGLAVGDIILTEGVAMLREGTPVLLREDDEQAAATIDQTDVIEE